MGKFGKVNHVSLNPLDYNITILGESGIGKTTLAKTTCEQLGVEYIHFDIGNERGAAAIEGIVSEPIEDWAKLDEVVTDIIENKTTDYPNLKVVVWDTLDELVLLAEAESIRQHNKKNPDNRVTSINAAHGGFGKGQDFAIGLIVDTISKLRKVGVSSIIIGHLKRSEITDVVSGETYSKLTADTTQKYFNAIRNKQHFVAVCYIDREIVKEKTGRKNVVTKQDITINKAVSESRVISFRDDTYSVDSKSRFAEIVDKVPMTTEDFIKAMKDAIYAEQSKSGETLKQAEKRQKEMDAKAEAEAEAYSNSKKNEADPIDLLNEINNAYKASDKEKRTQLKEKMKELGYSKLSEIDDVEVLKELYEIVA